METKTKDGKYFSELGSWKNLIELVILMVIFKVFGIFIAIIALVIMVFIIPKFSKNRNLKKDFE